MHRRKQRCATIGAPRNSTRQHAGALRSLIASLFASRVAGHTRAARREALLTVAVRMHLVEVPFPKCRETANRMAVDTPARVVQRSAHQVSTLRRVKQPQCVADL